MQNNVCVCVCVIINILKALCQLLNYIPSLLVDLLFHNTFLKLHKRLPPFTSIMGLTCVNQQSNRFHFFEASFSLQIKTPKQLRRTLLNHFSLFLCTASVCLSISLWATMFKNRGFIDWPLLRFTIFFLSVGQQWPNQTAELHPNWISVWEWTASTTTEIKGRKYHIHKWKWHIITPHHQTQSSSPGHWRLSEVDSV